MGQPQAGHLPCRWPCPALSAQNKVRGVLRRSPGSGNKAARLVELFWLCSGQRDPRRDWGFENWKNLLQSIAIYYPSLKIIIIGTKKEYMRAKKLKKIKPRNIVNLCDKTNIKELIEIINKSKFHISHDDGTMHVASIFNKKSIAIFSTLTEKFSWFPDNKNLNTFYPRISVKETKPNLVMKKFKARLN